MKVCKLCFAIKSPVSLDFGSYMLGVIRVIISFKLY